MRSAFLVSLLTLAAMAAADTVTLKDGRKLTGDVKRTPTGWVITDSAGRVTEVSTEQVAGIEADRPAASTDTQLDRLESLRRSVVNLADLRLIIDRYQQFLKQYPEGDVARQARADLADWQERLARGLVRVGSRWVTAEERDQIMRGHAAMIEQARQMVRASRLREAEPILAQVLQEDPANAAALYLRGVVFYRLEQLPAARKAFEAVLPVVPNHPATLNNLAVIHSRQNNPMASINAYLQAMKALPLNYDILNNVAEALHGVAIDQRNSTPVQKAQKEFEDQDAKLQAALGAQKLYRWGSSWVGPEEMEKLKAAEKEIKDKQDELSADFDKAKAGLIRIDQDMEANDRSLRQIEAGTWVRDAEGRLIRLSPPPVYYDILRDNDRLRLRKRDELAKLDQIRIASRDLQQKLPLPKFTGTQNLIGPEGTPMPAGAGPGPGPQPMVPPKPPPQPPATRPVNPLAK